MRGGGRGGGLRGALGTSNGGEDEWESRVKSGGLKHARWQKKKQQGDEEDEVAGGRVKCDHF